MWSSDSSRSALLNLLDLDSSHTRAMKKAWTHFKTTSHIFTYLHIICIQVTGIDPQTNRFRETPACCWLKDRWPEGKRRGNKFKTSVVKWSSDVSVGTLWNGPSTCSWQHRLHTQHGNRPASGRLRCSRYPALRKNKNKDIERHRKNMKEWQRDIRKMSK